MAKNNFIGTPLPPINDHLYKDKPPSTNSRTSSQRSTLNNNINRPNDQNNDDFMKGKQDSPSKNVFSTADKLVVNSKNHEYNVPFILSDKEVQECFSILDIHKHEYITSEEVTFFLDI